MSLKTPYKKGGMFEGANYLLFENAKNLRKNMTVAETVLWMHIKAGIDGLKFRRQHPIGLYIADFYCHRAKLIVEVDGSIHDLIEVSKEDKIRQQELESWGYKVIKFSNEQVLKEIEIVLETIKQTILQKQNASTKVGM